MLAHLRVKPNEWPLPCSSKKWGIMLLTALRAALQAGEPGCGLQAASAVLGAAFAKLHKAASLMVSSLQLGVVLCKV